jgi:hypothetical protein
MPRKRTSGTFDMKWSLTFAGDLETARVHFREMTDLVLKHAKAPLLNYTAYSMALFLNAEAGINRLERVRTELTKERRPSARGGRLSILPAKTGEGDSPC